MAIRLGFVFLLLALAIVADSSSSVFDATLDVASRYRLRGDNGIPSASSSCNGNIGDCIDADEEGMMESESSRRTLAGRPGYISYGAMKKNNIPCSKRGASYYGCTGHAQANPYTRGCSKITRCSRNGR